jgi:hypothetical protein
MVTAWSRLPDKAKGNTMSKKEQDTNQALPPGDNVDQIREILFGANMRAVGERFESVEKRLAKESTALKKVLENRILELEKLLGEFRDKAGDELNREGAQRDAGLASITESLAAFRLDAENQMAELQSEFNSEFKQIRQELTAAQKDLKKELNLMEKAHHKGMDQLGGNKIDRGELAGFLSDIAGRLVPAVNKRNK